MQHPKWAARRSQEVSGGCWWSVQKRTENGNALFLLLQLILMGSDFRGHLPYRKAGIKHNALMQHCHKRAEEAFYIHSSSASWRLKHFIWGVFQSQKHKRTLRRQTWADWSTTDGMKWVGKSKFKILILFRSASRTAQISQLFHDSAKTAGYNIF